MRSFRLASLMPASPEALTGLAPHFVERRPWLCAVLAAVCIAAGYLLLVNRYWHFTSDSALYLALARSLREGHGYAVGGVPHDKAPPGWPLILSQLIAASPQFLFINAAQCLLMLAAVAVLYVVLRQIADGPTALVVLFLTAMLFWLHEYAVALMSETPFFLFSNLSLLLLLIYLKARTDRYRALLIVGICAGWVMAFACRAVAMFWVGPFAFALLLGHRQMRPGGQRLLSTAFVAAVMVRSFLIYIRWSGQMADGSSSALGPHWVSYAMPRDSPARVVRAASRLPRWFLLVLCPPYEGLLRPHVPRPLVEVGHWACMAVILVGAARVLRHGQALVAGSLLFFAPFVLSGPGYKVTTGRYAIGVAPFVVLLFLSGLAAIGEFAQKRLRPYLTKRLLVNAGIAFVLVPNVLLLAGDIWVQRRRDFYAAYRAGAYAEFMGTMRWLDQAHVRELVAAPDVGSARAIAALTEARATRLPKEVRNSPPPALEQVKQWARANGADYVITFDRAQPWPTWHIPKRYLLGAAPTGPYWQLYRYNSLEDALHPIIALPEYRWPTEIPIAMRAQEEVGAVGAPNAADADLGQNGSR